MMIQLDFLSKYVMGGGFKTVNEIETCIGSCQENVKFEALCNEKNKLNEEPSRRYSSELSMVEQEPKLEQGQEQ